MTPIVRLALAATLAAPMLASAKTLVANGSFEADAHGAGTWPMQRDLDGSGGLFGPELRNDATGPAHDGTQHVATPDSTGRMFRDLDTTLGQPHVPSFADAAAGPGAGAVSNDIESSWNGGSRAGSLHAIRVASAVPEPANVALMLAGLGVVGFIAARRRG